MASNERVVRQAIEALVLHGVETPTNTQVREKLGGGSFSEITPILKSWREERDKARRAAIAMPKAVKERLDITLAQVWLEVCETASEQLVATQDLHHKEQLEWGATYKELELDNIQLVKKVNRMNLLIEELKDERKALNRKIEIKSDEITELKLKNVAIQARALNLTAKDEAETKLGELVEDGPKIILL